MLKSLIYLRKLMILSSGVSLKSFLQFLQCSIFSDMIKFSASNEKMFDGERFITGYTKRRLIISE